MMKSEIIPRSRKHRRGLGNGVILPVYQMMIVINFITALIITKNRISQTSVILLGVISITNAFQLRVNLHKTKIKHSHTLIANPIMTRNIHYNNRLSSILYTHSENNDNDINIDSNVQDTFKSDDDITEIIEQLGRSTFQKYFPFTLDSWQAQAGGHILSGKNVIVCAPTGAGKTVVGEMGLHLTFQNSVGNTSTPTTLSSSSSSTASSSIYTTPLKALSNQKFAELRKLFGPSNVGLSTGDMSINRGARVTVMTTEVYRNMAWRATSSSPIFTATPNDNNSNYDYEASERKNDNQSFTHDDNEYNELRNNKVVILDEFHYMGQAGRGGVWEESIITNPSHTQIICLSATLPNGLELSKWIENVTGRETILIEAGMDKRPVPLRYLFATNEGLFSLFRDKDAGPGSPKGLLGLRGDFGGKRTNEVIQNDSTNSSSSKMNKKKGFGGKDTNTKITELFMDKQLPRGLELNPDLQNIAKRRMEKIQRIVARKALEREMMDRMDDSSPMRRRGGMSVKEEQREKERLLKSEMRKAVPSLFFLLRNLDAKNLLPAIIFIFSRAGCDEAATSVCRSLKLRVASKSNDIVSENRTRKEDDNKRKSRSRGKKANQYDASANILRDENGRKFRYDSDYVNDDTLSSILDTAEFVDNMISMDTLQNEQTLDYYATCGLLSAPEVKEVSRRVKIFNSENDEIKFSDSIVEQLLLGVGSHHAGQLPAHKAFVEALFRAQLMKVVFATETLAAGINMPARTTVICSMAKRGDSSISLLETSNLLQMAGRAGRRGMDTDGSCVLVATPFEGPDTAAQILTSEIKPVQSQFSPSYSLAVNLIGRGEGKLDIARKLVQKSFAMWGKKQAEDKIAVMKDMYGDEFDEVLETAAQSRFLDTLKKLVMEKIEKKGAKAKVSHKRIVEVLDDKTLLKKESKTYTSLLQILALEQNTLQYLVKELDAALSNDAESQDIDGLEALFAEDVDGIQTEIERQKRRVRKSELELSDHIFTTMANVANGFLSNSSSNLVTDLYTTLALLKKNQHPDGIELRVSAEDLTFFAKSAVTVNRKRRKQKNVGEELGVDETSLVEQLGSFEVDTGDDSWDDMLALVDVLKAYGCIVPQNDNIDDPEKKTYSLTPAGENVGLIGVDNALWCLVAIGGAWDVNWDSKNLDRLRTSMKELDSLDPYGNNDLDALFSDDNDTSSVTDLEENEDHSDSVILPQAEAAKFISLLRSLSPSEMAGYISCLSSDSSRGSQTSALASFQSLTPIQQRVIQSALLSLERLMEVQKRCSVDDETTSRVQLELSTCRVVTAWAGGCTWSEAMEISGSAPGDLVRTLHRAIDVLRQLGNLPVNPARAVADTRITVSPGIHPEIRRLCREAARAMDRFPVKDPLPFDEEEEAPEEEIEENSKDEEVVVGDGQLQ